MELTFNFAGFAVFPYEVAGPGGVLLGAGRATSTLPVTLKPVLSLLSAAIMSAGGEDSANEMRGGTRLNHHRFCHIIALMWMCIKVS